MGESYGICLIGVMDSLWFNKIILFPDPNSLIPPPKTTTTKASPTSQSSLPYQSSMNSIPEDDISFSLNSSTSIITTHPLQTQHEDDSRKEEESEKIDILEAKGRLTRLNISTSKARSQSSSPSSANCSRRNMRQHQSVSTPVTRLHKSMSCKTLRELEEEEVKGFMDLGFKFDSENLCPRMMTVVPGLQRLGGHNGTEEKGAKCDEKDDEIHETDEEEEGKKKGMVLRPYLSEAWLIRRPDSPLLNLKIPKVSTVADMKKHLKNWARTVAYEIQQES